jgi:hypothetical protein
MIGQIFSGWAFLFLGVLALAAFHLGSFVGSIKGEGGRSLLRGLEAGLLAFIGGFLARSLVCLLLGGKEGPSGAGLAVGWFFFLWPGVVDSVAKLASAQPLTAPGPLLWIAAAVGALAGMMDGLWKVHRWRGLGVLTFLLDMTWGLANTTNGILFHLVNFVWAGHADEPRSGAHRYRSGFRFKSGFAVTQGSVMSNMGQQGPSSGLFAHENTHVWQNRIFGPIFTLSYLGWMVVFFLPGLIAGAVSGVGVGAGIEQWCYYNNPWETWAYRVGAGPRHPNRGPLVWSDLVVLLVSIPFMAGVVALMVLAVVKAWG